MQIDSISRRNTPLCDEDSWNPIQFLFIGKYVPYGKDGLFHPVD